MLVTAVCGTKGSRQNKFIRSINCKWHPGDKEERWGRKKVMHSVFAHLKKTVQLITHNIMKETRKRTKKVSTISASESKTHTTWQTPPTLPRYVSGKAVPADATF